MYGKGWLMPSCVFRCMLVCVSIDVMLSVPLIGLRHKTQWREDNLRVRRFWVPNTFPRPYLNSKSISLIVKSKRSFLERTLYIWFLDYCKNYAVTPYYFHRQRCLNFEWKSWISCIWKRRVIWCINFSSITNRTLNFYFNL